MSIAPAARNFGQLIAEHEEGRFHQHASDAMHDMLVKTEEAAGLRGGTAKCKMTVTFEFSMDGGIVEATAEITTKVPKLKRGKSVFWLTPEGHLSRANPRQPELPLRDVAAASAAVARSLA